MFVFKTWVNQFSAAIAVTKILTLTTCGVLVSCSHEALKDPDAHMARYQGEKVEVLRPKSGKFVKPYDGYGHFYQGRCEDSLDYYKPGLRSESRDALGRPFFRFPEPEFRRNAYYGDLLP